VNDRPDWESRIDSGFVLMVRLTGIATGEGDAGEVMTILPL
jgi:hypothetical protein